MKKPSDIVSFDFTLDNIISVEARRDTNPDDLHDKLRYKLQDLIDDSCECFMFEGIYDAEV